MTICFLIEKKYFSRRLDYVLRSLSQRLGYPYQLIFDKDQLKKHHLVITYLPADRLNDIPSYSALNIYNDESLNDLDDVEGMVNLFEWGDLSIPVIGKKLTSDILKKFKADKKHTHYRQSIDSPWIITIDVFLNLFYHLSRYEEKWRHFTEETATDYSTSILSRHHNLKLPIVDVLIDYLDQLIRQRLLHEKLMTLRLLSWPGAEKFAVALTHDVDITRAVPFKSRVLESATGYIYKLIGKDKPLAESKEQIKKQDANVWNFPELLKDYQKKNWRATFFFITKMTEGRHLRYNVFSKKFRTVIKSLLNQQHEVALHPSKFAFDRPRYYRQEKEKLESVMGTEVQGMRQHYLRAKFPRLWIYAEKAALAYDASLGYNFQAGFRAGTSHPFKTYDVFSDRPIALTEFSLHLFEYNLPDANKDMVKAKIVIEQIVRQVAQYHGLLVCLLHPSNYRNPVHRELWEYIQDLLCEKKIFVRTLKDHLHWLRKKERIDVKLKKQSRDQSLFEITLPESLENFAIEVLGSGKPIVSKGVKITEAKKNIYQLSATERKFTIKLERR